jgi:nitrogen regulatory protein PII-like uncharacterized protein
MNTFESAFLKNQNKAAIHYGWQSFSHFVESESTENKHKLAKDIFDLSELLTQVENETELNTVKKYFDKKMAVDWLSVICLLITLLLFIFNASKTIFGIYGLLFGAVIIIFQELIKTHFKQL